jgi:hypothetical protein
MYIAWKCHIAYPNYKAVPKQTFRLLNDLKVYTNTIGFCTSVNSSAFVWIVSEDLNFKSLHFSRNFKLFLVGFSDEFEKQKTDEFEKQKRKMILFSNEICKQTERTIC